ncbi:MAG TPA: GAF domain-containing protein [Candidatus Limnocylindrales bacterium]
MPPLAPRPIDATLSVTKAARVLGVHPNTIRAWSDAGRLRYYRINPRGDRRYRLGDLQRFLAAAAGGPADGVAQPPGSSRPAGGRGFGTRRPFESSALVTASAHRAATALAALPAISDIPDSLERETRRRDLETVAFLASLAAEPATAGVALDAALDGAVAAIRENGEYHLVVAWELRGDTLIPRADAGPPGVRLVELRRGDGPLDAALAHPDEPILATDPSPAHAVLPDRRPELTVAIPGPRGPWGVLLIAGGGRGSLGPRDADLALAAARAVGAIVRGSQAAERVAHELHRADALRRVASDISSRLDLDQILSGLVDHALVLFEGDRAAVFLRQHDGKAVAEVARGLSQTYLNSVRDFPPRSLPGAAITARRPLFAIGYRDDPRGAGLRAAIVQEGYDTISSAPLFDGDELLGLLNVYHDRPHEWTDGELDTMAALATQAAVAIRTAQNYTQLSRWAAQLQSIQQLGTRLSRLSTVGEIGVAIASELQQLIDFHNVRVYRQRGAELIPVAMRGQVGAYVDETPEQLRVHVGEGITGWVAEHKVPQSLPDAAKDSRANTIPGTEEDLDESMLLAPMLFEDEVLGVLVLAKLGLNQFSEDDLRLLVIYASFAAQAMANADATERLHAQSASLERQLRSQRELLKVTESILSTLEPRAVLDQIADRLGGLVAYDNISIEVYDPVTHVLHPLTARGVNADEYLKEWLLDETGLAPWAIEHNEAVLVVDQFYDDRVLPWESVGRVHGGLIVVPLRGREGVTGVLTLERLGEGNTFTEEEFELVKLFAAQVSIALQNAEIYRDIEIRARTDGLTGLLNHATFRERLAASVARADAFSLVMMDLDDFKGVNDALGHQAGDRLLTEMARAIVAAGRESDHVFRYGGDEFALILPGADVASALTVAERVREAVRAVGEPGSAWDRGGVICSASFGLATFPTDGTTAESILLAADRACFVAKRSGHGRIATADEGLALASEFSLQQPTPVDSPTAPAA